MIEILNKKDCCGCTACFNACPKKCISMQPDEEGFLYPVADAEVCINCGLCEKVCPILNPKQEEQNKIFGYVLRTKSQTDLMSSTSGGFTTPLAEWVFKNGGKVWTASYGNNWEICHAEFESLGDGFNKTRGSKYVQSYLRDTFSIIKSELDSGTLVCFIGTTCQVYGLKSYLRKEYDNLITIDLVCHGTPSPKLWRKYIEYQTEKNESEIKSINFRNKTYGYHSGTMLLEFENGKQYTGSARIDYMLKSFFSEISSRPCCYSCPFKHLHRVSDFTIFDCWHAAEMVPKLVDDDCGYTNVLVHTDKGGSILAEISEKYVLFPVDVNRAVELDGIMIQKSAIPHKGRDSFYHDLEEHDLKEHIQRYIPIKRIDYLLEACKKTAYKLGLMGVLRRIKG